MANYKSRARRTVYSTLRNQHIQKGDGWTPLPFCGTGLSYTVSDSAGCGVLGRRMVPETTTMTTTTRIILSTNGIIRQNGDAENAPYTLPYYPYYSSMIPHTKYDLSYCTVRSTVRVCRGGREVAA